MQAALMNGHLNVNIWNKPTPGAAEPPAESFHCQQSEMKSSTFWKAYLLWLEWIMAYNRVWQYQSQLEGWGVITEYKNFRR